MTIDELWNEMSKLEGYTFKTVNGLPFTIIKCSENTFYVDRNGSYGRNIRKKDMEYILNHPNENTSYYSKFMHCASYALVVYKNIVNKK